ncbi:acyl carrier protein [Nonomuraea deserti]|uniref:Acyl carrier protein n=1 Tax=Nonomuraea deserti TaxID=1848322 RepID=A0A4R4W4Y9_9ACTN|nr:acyl carrier protein [Nonomuraea deserti]TDD11073.1 acyl carrier protein [Nonomuraea deserti]
MSEMKTIERSTVSNTIAGELAAILNREVTGISDSTSLFDELGLDSTTVLELLMRLEDTLMIEFDTDTLEQHHFETVGTLADYVIEQA